jgi:hypothetical protein
MKYKLFIILCLCYAAASRLRAQDLFPIKVAQYAQYTGEALPTELRRFAPDPEVEKRVVDILTVTGKSKNFDLVAANVKSVAVVVDVQMKRYILYSKRYFLEQEDDTYRVAMLAWAIGHHVSEHTLEKARYEAEQVATDEYAGFALFRSGRPQRLVEHLFRSDTNRLTLILKGFKKAEVSLLIAPGAGFADNNDGDAVPGLSEFPIPPPKPSAQDKLTELFGGCTTLGECNRRLRKALDKAGYYEKGYFYVKGGFALITRLEQTNEKGVSLSETNRWKAKPVREESFSVTAYLRSLLTAQPGYFRTFIFVVTATPFKADPNRRITKDDMEPWYGEGANVLPPKIAATRFEKGITQVEALVYEFKVQQAGTNGAQIKQSSLTGKQHLENAKILVSLRP